MGEIADMMIEGFLDEETGEVIDGHSPGHPRSPTRDARNKKKRKKKERKIPKPLAFICATCQERFENDRGLDIHRVQAHGCEPTTKAVKRMVRDEVIIKDVVLGDKVDNKVHLAMQCYDFASQLGPDSMSHELKVERLRQLLAGNETDVGKYQELIELLGAPEADHDGCIRNLHGLLRSHAERMEERENDPEPVGNGFETKYSELAELIGGGSHTDLIKSIRLYRDSMDRYEELRKLIDGGSESMTHADAVDELNRRNNENPDCPG